LVVLQVQDQDFIHTASLLHKAPVAEVCSVAVIASEVRDLQALKEQTDQIAPDIQQKLKILAELTVPLLVGRQESA